MGITRLGSLNRIRGGSTRSAWINKIFAAGQVNKGNVVRRSMRTVDQYASAKELKAEVKKRGFHMAIIGDQYVIICNTHGTMRLIC